MLPIKIFGDILDILVSVAVLQWLSTYHVNLLPGANIDVTPVF